MSMQSHFASATPLAANWHELPPWAVAAAGESRLEPVCGTTGKEPINLSELRSYCIGRSPFNHIELHHFTSSRRHAIMFHHPNGTCCILDCASNYGTYVNGRRIPPLTPIPLRRGSLIRYGGPGAPSFILKCFTTALKRFISDLDGIADAFSSAKSREFLLLQHQTEKTGVACIRGGEGGIACISNEHDAPTAALVLMNTRLNAYTGGVSSLSLVEGSLVSRAKDRYNGKIQKFQTSPIRRKRSSVCFSESDENTLPSKKMHVSSPVRGSIKSILMHNNDKPESAKIKVVEKVMSTPVQKRVLCGDCTMNYPAAITPDELSLESEGEEDDVAKVSIRNPFLEVTVPTFVAQF